MRCLERGLLGQQVEPLTGCEVEGGCGVWEERVEGGGHCGLSLGALGALCSTALRF